jgi:hypothetical protein
MSSKKRHELAQFRDRFRSFRLAAGEGIEKVGKTAYRLKVAAAEASAAEAPVAEAPVAEASIAEAPVAEEATENLIEFEVIAVPDDAPETEPTVVEEIRLMLEHPAALEEADMGFGEPMGASAADSSELAADHVIFSAWPESMQPAAAEHAGVEAQAAEAQTEAQIEAEVRELVGGSHFQERRHASESLVTQAEQAVARTWRDGGHWLGRRFAGLYSRN